MHDLASIALLLLFALLVILPISAFFFPNDVNKAIRAVLKNDIPALRSALKNIDVNRPMVPALYCGNQFDSTLLHLAAMEADLETVQFLLDCGADSSLQNEMGRTPLICAITWRSDREYEDIVAALTDDKSINLSDEKSPPLYWSASLNCANCTRLLILSGADLDQKNIYHKTALHASVIRKNWEIAAMLVRAGADCDVPDSEGRAPFDYASEKEKALLHAMIGDEAQ